MLDLDGQYFEISCLVKKVDEQRLGVRLSFLAPPISVYGRLHAVFGIEVARHYTRELRMWIADCFDMLEASKSFSLHEQDNWVCPDGLVQSLPEAPLLNESISRYQPVGI
jgi:hypothetical protein